MAELSVNIPKKPEHSKGEDHRNSRIAWWDRHIPPTIKSRESGIP